MLADVAMASNEASRKVAAREVALEGIRHVARQGRRVDGFGVGDEGLVVLAGAARAPLPAVAGGGEEGRPGTAQFTLSCDSRLKSSGWSPAFVPAPPTSP